MEKSDLHIQSKSLPELPGVYQFYDDEKIICVSCDFEELKPKNPQEENKITKL